MSYNEKEEETEKFNEVLDQFKALQTEMDVFRQCLYDLKDKYDKVKDPAGEFKKSLYYLKDRYNIVAKRINYIYENYLK